MSKPTKSGIDTILRNGLQAHKKGNMDEALAHYTAILNTNPTHTDANHNKGLLLVSINKIQESLPYFRTAVLTNPNISQYWLSFIDALIRADRLDDALSALLQAKTHSIRDSDFARLETILSAQKQRTSDESAQIKELVGLYNQGNLKDVCNQAGLVLKHYPESFTCHSIIGVAYAGLEDYSNALASYQRALKIKPDHAETHYNAGNAYKGLNNLQAASHSYRKALELAPDFPEACLNLGIVLIAQQHYDSAIRYLQKSLDAWPDHVSTLENITNACQQSGNIQLAITYYLRLVNLKPESTDYRVNLANALLETGKTADAIKHYQTILRQYPDHLLAHNNIATTFLEMGELELAQSHLLQSIQINPDFASAYFNLGNVLQDMGDIEAAIDQYQKTLQLNPDHAAAYHNLCSLDPNLLTGSQITRISGKYRDISLTNNDRAHYCFALAYYHEKQSDPIRFMDCLSQANKLRKTELGYQLDGDIRLFSSIQAAFSNVPSESGLPKSTDGRQPVFIVGMPRSGTTLVEQILSSHSQVYGAGELLLLKQAIESSVKPGDSPSAKQIKSIRSMYLAGLESINTNRPILTDKMPLNFRWIGYIRSAFPEAPIIHITRDARATCWSIYRQYFARRGNGYAYDMSDITGYYTIYRELMEFWHGQYPGTIYDLNYEKLTEDTETESRKLLDHIGIEWEDSCLEPQNNMRAVQTASSKQVRERIYTGSSDKWKQYAAHLEPMIKALEKY